MFANLTKTLIILLSFVVVLADVGCRASAEVDPVKSSRNR